MGKQTPLVATVPTTTTITYGQTLASSTLGTGAVTNAAGGTVTGSFAFTTPSIAPNAGTTNVSVTFTPTDTADYNTTTATVTVTVGKQTPLVATVPTTTAITYGQTLASSTLGTGAVTNAAGGTVAGTFAFTTPTIAPNAGSTNVSVTFTPTDSADYNTATATVTVTVNKQTPLVATVPTTTTITYGQTLASSTLGTGAVTNAAGGMVAGTFDFTTPSIVPNAGSTNVSVTFTPTDTADYNTATATVTVTVSKQTPLVATVPTTTAITYGQTLASSTLGTGSVTNAAGSTVAGTFDFTTPTIAPSAGSTNVSVTFTPTDTADYNTTTATVTVTVGQAALGITAGNDSKTYGEAKTYGSGQTNFTATGLLPGETIDSVTITASGGAATNAAVGTYNLTPSAPTGGTFVAANYNITYTNGTLTVNAAVLGITANSTNRTYGAVNPDFTYTASGFVNGETTAVLSGSPSLTTTATTNSAVGGYTITAAAGSLSAANYTFSFTNGTLTVNPLAVVLTGSRAYDGTTNAAFGILSVANAVNGDNVLVASGTGGLADKSAGTQGLTSFGDLALGNNPAGNYTLSGASGSVTITQAVTSVTVLSSLNPVGYRGSIYFTATNLPADATGYVLFLTNSAAFSSNSLSSGGAVSLTITNLPRGTNVITAQYAGDGNYLGSTNLLAGGQVVTNHPPVAGNATYTRSVPSIKIFLSTLFTNVTDVDGDTITLAGVSASTNGIMVSTNSSFVLYGNTNGVNDRFDYTVHDGYGGSSTGTIAINYYPFPVTGQQTSSLTVSNGVATLGFFGIPTYRYGIERSTNLLTWVPIWVTNAPSNGAFHYNDNFSDLGTNVPSSAYYRLHWNP